MIMVMSLFQNLSLPRKAKTNKSLRVPRTRLRGTRENFIFICYICVSVTKQQLFKSLFGK